jgi:hypothetical protein
MRLETNEAILIRLAASDNVDVPEPAFGLAEGELVV